jgi:hypothetical protein
LLRPFAGNLLDGVLMPMLCAEPVVFGFQRLGEQFSGLDLRHRIQAC